LETIVHNCQIAQLLIAPCRSHKEKMETHKGMYNGREGMSSLSLPRYLEKAQDITCTMHYLLLSLLLGDGARKEAAGVKQ
jgi:hypothetical protein